jgi:exosortase
VNRELAPRFLRTKTALRLGLSAAVWLLPWLLLVWHLSTPWTRSPQYQFGWIVVPLVLYLSWRRWQELGDPSASGRGAMSAAILCALLLAPVWWIRVATPDWSVVSYSLATLVLGFTIALLATRLGWPAAWSMACPLALILVAVPWPHRAETFVIQSLTRLVASAATEVVQWMGIAAERRGNLIALSSGTIELSEACSGLRSLQSMLLAALVVGELYGLRLGRRLLLVLAGFAIALVLNLVRHVILTLIAASHGIATMEEWHDPAGLLILLLSVPLLFLLAARQEDHTGLTIQRGPALSWKPLPIWLAASLCIWFVGIVAGVESWYRAHEDYPLVFRPLKVRWPGDKADFRIDPLPDRTRDILLCSQAQNASWKEDDRTLWTLTSVEWSPRETSPQFARVHRPEVCLQAVGLELVRKMPPQILPVSGGTLQFEPLEMRAGRVPIYVFFALHESGNRDDVREFDETPRSRLRRAIDGQRNCGQQMIEIRIAGLSSYEAALDAVTAKTPTLLHEP